MSSLARDKGDNLERKRGQLPIDFPSLKLTPKNHKDRDFYNVSSCKYFITFEGLSFQQLLNPKTLRILLVSIPSEKVFLRGKEGQFLPISSTW